MKYPVAATSPESIVRYTEYYCYFFAVATHELTGWKILEVGDDEKHYINKTPDGRYYDVRGFSKVPLNAYGQPDIIQRECTAAEVLDSFSPWIEGLPQARIDAAHMLARAASGLGG